MNVGQKLGHYRLLERLAHGGMGIVYRALDEMLDREVAIKILDADADDPERFRDEATTIARLSHPGIAAVYQLFRDDRWVMVMEFVRGQTLEDLLVREGALPPEYAADLCMQALSALAYSHRMGVVHRDLKPGNLMVTPNGTLKILDFGIARMVGSTHHTHTGFTMGTPAYMAPEQVKGNPVDSRTDLYAVGVIFFRLITGALPFAAKTPLALAQAHITESPPTVTSVNPHAPLWVDEIASRALAKKPADRFQTADEFRHALKRAVSRGPAESDSRRHDRTERLEVQKPTRIWSIAVWSPTVLVFMALSVIGMRASWKQSRSSASAPVVTSSHLPSSTLAIPPFGRLLPALRGVVPATVVAPKPLDVHPTPPVDAAPLPETQMAFAKVKLMTVDGTRASSRDVMLNLSGDRLTMLPMDGGPPVGTLFYRQLMRATYVRARDPQWDPAFSAPGIKLESSILSRARHWLAIQTRDSYAILQLDGNQASNLVQAFEEHTGLHVDRPVQKTRADDQSVNSGRPK